MSNDFYSSTSDYFSNTTLSTSTESTGITQDGAITAAEHLRRLWYQMFLSSLISSIILHAIGSAVLFIRLRKHMYTKWLIIVIILAGIVTPLILGNINNILIASILVFSGRYDLPLYAAILIGLCQTIFVVTIGFLKILQTL